MTIGRALALALGAAVVAGLAGATLAGAPRFVDITWFSVSNVYYEIGDFRIVTDGYVTRLPAAHFSGGGGGLANSAGPAVPDADAVSRVIEAFGGRSRVNLLLTGHSHFDHSFDTATWARLTGAPVMGPGSTCLQAEAQGILRCTAVVGGERVPLTDDVTMRVVRWNHSGSHERNPEQHDAVELHAVPKKDPATGGLRAGVAEDFPNGGGNRAYLFTVEGRGARFSWFFQNSASASDLTAPIVVDGVSYGAPLDNLRAAMQDAGLTSVDLWIGTGGEEIAALVLPVLHPKAYLPVHWDSFYSPFEKGVVRPFADEKLEAMLAAQRVTLVRPAQFMDKWRLDASGIRAIPNGKVKGAFGW